MTTVLAADAAVKTQDWHRGADAALDAVWIALGEGLVADYLVQRVSDEIGLYADYLGDTDPDYRRGATDNCDCATDPELASRGLYCPACTEAQS